MNKYVVAFFSDGEGVLKQEVVEAKSVFDAKISYLGLEEDDFDEDALDNYLMNTEAFIEVLDLNKALGTGRPGGGLQTRISQFDSESRFH